jgi:hypothetical protein
MPASNPARTAPHLEIPNPPSPLDRPKLNARGTTTHRLPPPALFQGPPSKDASHISLALPGSGGGGGGNAGERTAAVPETPVSAESEQQQQQPQTQQQEQQPSQPPQPHQQRPRVPLPARAPAAASFSGVGGPPSSLRQPAAAADDRRAENLWAEMQKTLADVEVSAMNTSHVFGTKHANALEDLRTAQLSLAQTWAKSEADELHEHEHDAVAATTNVGKIAVEAAGSPKTASPADAANAKSAFTDNKNLEEETNRDIQLARKRREANDRYFQQVSRGVLDVVNELDEVAGAMRRVERESREIWDESTEDTASGSESAGSVVTDHTATGLTDSPVSSRKG